MREIVTLQLGNLSNYAGTHFWNTQESYFTYSDDAKSVVDHNIHWRPGVGADGSDTFLPRTVIYDLKGGFGSLKKINELYDNTEDATSSSLWHGKPSIHQQTTLVPSAYQQSLNTGSSPPKLSSSTVRYWSDFSRVFSHPKSLVQMYDYELHSTTRPFERFPMGTELFSTLDKEHDIVDRDWRPFVEECDRMQGIQVYTTMDDAWGGFASSYIEALRDEYPKTCIWVWGLQSPILDSPREKRQLRLTNSAHTMTELCQHASAVVPLSAPEKNLPSDMKLDPRSSWNVSALLATAAETILLPSRLSGDSNVGGTSLDDIVDGLNTTGNRPLFLAQLEAGDLGRQNKGASSSLDLSGINGLKAPQRNSAPRAFSNMSTFRATSKTLSMAELAENEETRRRVVGDPVFQSYPIPLQYPLLDSFPSNMFSHTDGADKVDVRTSIFTNQAIEKNLQSLRSQVVWSLDLSEREDLTNGLAELAGAYREDWSSGSDEDEDDS